MPFQFCISALDVYTTLLADCVSASRLFIAGRMRIEGKGGLTLIPCRIRNMSDLVLGPSSWLFEAWNASQGPIKILLCLWKDWCRVDDGTRVCCLVYKSIL